MLNIFLRRPIKIGVDFDGPLNFLSDNVSWDTINKEISKIPWKTLFSEKDTETCTYIFLRCLLNICMEIIPRKTTNGKSKIPR